MYSIQGARHKSMLVKKTYISTSQLYSNKYKNSDHNFYGVVGVSLTLCYPYQKLVITKATKVLKISGCFLQYSLAAKFTPYSLHKKCKFTAVFRQVNLEHKNCKTTFNFHFLKLMLT